MQGVDERMYAAVRIFERGTYTPSDVRDAARARVEALGTAASVVTLLAIKAEDGALVTVEIFETFDEMTVAQRSAGTDSWLSPADGGPQPGRAITGEIVFQRGL